MPENNGTYSKVRKLLFNEISLIISVVAVVFGTYFFITGPQNVNQTDITDIKTDITLIRKDIDTIVNNHLFHIQQGIDNECERNDAQDVLLKNIEISVAKIITILDK